MVARRLFIALSIAIVISGVCTIWLGRVFARSGNRASTRLHYVAVKRAVNAGDSLGADGLQVVDWPSALPLQGAFTKPEEVVGRVMLYPLAAGEPILERQLSSAGAGLSAHIPDGMRAISLKSNEVVGVAGYLLPGTRVDVLATLPSVAGQGAVTTTVLQDVQVLTAGQKMQPDPEGKATHVDVVTLLVSPDDAEKAVLASTQGTVHFVLRNNADHARVSQQEADLSELSATRVSMPAHAEAARPRVSSQPRATPVAAKVTPKYSVQVLRGEKQSVETF